MKIETTGTADRIQPPLIKWPGGKRSLLGQLLPHVPSRFGTYYEPFFGGGALFFALRPHRAVLSDLNRDLVTCYETVRSQPDDLIRCIRKLENSEEAYYRVRQMKPRGNLQRAARLLYLTRLSFNGIHRVNLKGEFNVPYGYKTHLTSVDESLVKASAEALEHADLRCGDFELTTADAQRGDLVYLDPPYTVAHANNGFVKYNEHIFSWADQVRLLAHAKVLVKRGCYVIISNADHSSIDELYAGIEKVTIERHSIIAASSVHRRRITESLFVLRPNN